MISDTQLLLQKIKRLEAQFYVELKAHEIDNARETLNQIERLREWRRELHQKKLIAKFVASSKGITEAMKGIGKAMNKIKTEIFK